MKMKITINNSIDIDLENIENCKYAYELTIDMYKILYNNIVIYCYDNTEYCIIIDTKDNNNVGLSLYNNNKIDINNLICKLHALIEVPEEKYINIPYDDMSVSIKKKASIYAIVINLKENDKFRSKAIDNELIDYWLKRYDYK